MRELKISEGRRLEADKRIEKLEKRVNAVERKNDELENLVENLRINNDKIERENEVEIVKLSF